MADISDVENAIVDIIASSVYPNGIGQPSTINFQETDDNGVPIGSTVNASVKVMRGWVSPDQVDSDLRTYTTLNISVFPVTPDKNVTRYMKHKYDQLPTPVATLKLTNTAGAISLESGGDIELENGGELLLEGSTTYIEVGGSVSVPQNVGIIVNNQAYAYSVQANDTTQSIAAELASLINADFPATATGNVIAVQGAYLLIPRVGAVGTAIREIARQQCNIRITLWASTPEMRDAAAVFLLPLLQDMNFIAMPDGSQCRWIYVSSPITDKSEKEYLYRRDLIFSAEYGTTQSMQAPTIMLTMLNLNAGPIALENSQGDIELEDGSGSLVLEGNTYID